MAYAYHREIVIENASCVQIAFIEACKRAKELFGDAYEFHIKLKQATVIYRPDDNKYIWQHTFEVEY